MADFPAIAAVTAALTGLLDAARDPAAEKFGVAPVTAAGLAANAEQPAPGSLGVWLYAVTPNAQRRSVRPVVVPGEPRRLPGTAVDLHYLLVARAGDALMQQRMLGWGIRVLEDHPSLPAAVLDNGAFEHCFAEDETVELTLETLTGAEENDIWQVAPTARQPAAPYLVRMVVLDSRRTLPAAPDVEERELVLRA